MRKRKRVNQLVQGIEEVAGAGKKKMNSRVENGPRLKREKSKCTRETPTGLTLALAQGTLLLGAKARDALGVREDVPSREE